jgi:hypothetical protein
MIRIASIARYALLHNQHVEIARTVSTMRRIVSDHMQGKLFPSFMNVKQLTYKQ